MSELTLLKYEVIFHWIGVVFYILSTISFTYSLFFKKEDFLHYGMILAFIGLVPHGIALGFRWYVAGHGPYMAKYEVLSSNAWIIILMFLITSVKIQKLKPLGIIVIPLSLLMMTLGLFTNPEIRRLPPTLRGIWLVIHILFAKLAAGGIIIAVGCAVSYLLKEKKMASEFLKKLPSHEALNAYSFKFVGFGFIFWSITIAAGAIWANESWGRYWGWDPIETWSLITWLLFGFYLHSRYFLKWDRRKGAWMLLICFLFSIMTIFIIPFIIDSLHSEYFK